MRNSKNANPGSSRKRIRYADHLQFRVALRRIPKHLPRNLYRRTKEVFFDNITGNYVAIGRARYGGKIRDMMVAFVEKDDEITLVTVHPLKPRQKANRVASGRWVSYEREKK